MFSNETILSFRNVSDLSEDSLRVLAARADSAFKAEFAGSKPAYHEAQVNWSEAERSNARNRLRDSFRYIADNMEVYNNEPERRLQARIALSSDIGLANKYAEQLRIYSLPVHVPTPEPTNVGVSKGEQIIIDLLKKFMASAGL